MQRKLKKLDYVFWGLLFVLGLVMFLLPVATELIGYQTDAAEYAEIALQIRPPDSPGPIMPLPMKTEDPEQAGSMPAVVLPDTEFTWAEAEGTEPLTEPEEQSEKEGSVSPEPEAISDAEKDDTPGQTATVLPETMEVPAAEAPTDEPADHPGNKPSPAQPSQPTKEPQAGIDLNACLAQNPDFAAWITIPETVINYPVVRSDNSAYYLHHLFTGKDSKLGCLFSLTSSDYQTPSRNIAIYGHHLSQSDAMFSTLLNYKDSAWYTDHPMIRLDTLYGTREYRIFAVLNMKVSDWDPATASFSSDKAFLRFVNRAKDKSFYDIGIPVSADDHILTLITCDRSYGGASGRLIVMAVQQ